MKLKLQMSKDQERFKCHTMTLPDIFGETRFCADSHCKGTCGNPGLFLRRYFDMNCNYDNAEVLRSNAPQDEQSRYYRDYKAHGAMVACGPIWQYKPWQGERIYLPEEYNTDEIFNSWWY